MLIPLDRNLPALVTGSGGVLGHAILRRLRDQGFQRILCPSRGELDLLDRAATQAYFSAHRPQIVIHLAALVYGLGGNLENQMASALNNTAIDNNLFAALARHPVAKLFYAGTVASYPYPYASLPLREEEFFDGLPHRGEFGYAMAKRHAYAYMKILGEETGTEPVYGVFTNLYGEHDRFDVKRGHVIPSLVGKAHVAAASGSPLEVWGDGSAVRDFLHAEDAAHAVMTCLENGAGPEPINISSGKGVPISELAQAVARIAGVREVKFLSDKPTGIANRVVSNDRLKRLGFTVSVELEAGLARTCAWYASNLAAAKARV